MKQQIFIPKPVRPCTYFAREKDQGPFHIRTTSGYEQKTSKSIKVIQGKDFMKLTKLHVPKGLIQSTTSHTLEE